MRELTIIFASGPPLHIKDVLGCTISLDVIDENTLEGELNVTIATTEENIKIIEIMCAMGLIYVLGTEYLMSGFSTPIRLSLSLDSIECGEKGMYISDAMCSTTISNLGRLKEEEKVNLEFLIRISNKQSEDVDYT